ncbi:MAG: hypothetical protein NZ480_09160 [Bdellovibrionaceae bacterium]|nr:hypothetical protein [Pseudobdellovibrionaceae bacterium]MDW8189435.1 hypothetical protein [Pseudobdellovibrionaceae bacterium]
MSISMLLASHRINLGLGLYLHLMWVVMLGITWPSYAKQSKVSKDHGIVCDQLKSQQMIHPDFFNPRQPFPLDLLERYVCQGSQGSTPGERLLIKLEAPSSCKKFAILLQKNDPPGYPSHSQRLPNYYVNLVECVDTGVDKGIDNVLVLHKTTMCYLVPLSADSYFVRLNDMEKTFKELNFRFWFSGTVLFGSPVLLSIAGQSKNYLWFLLGSILVFSGIMGHDAKWHWLYKSLPNYIRKGTSQQDIRKNPIISINAPGIFLLERFANCYGAACCFVNNIPCHCR